MKWFKHETDANMDAKLQEVLLDYGLEGYGLYWYCIELIAQRVTTNNLTFELEHDTRIIARNTGSTPQKVEEMMKAFIRLGLLNHDNGHVFCLTLAKRCDDFTAKAVRRVGVKSLTNQSVGVSPSNSEKVPLEVEDRREVEDRNRSKNIEDKETVVSDSVCQLKNIKEDGFDYWYKAYPKKIARPDAKKAFKAATKKMKEEEFMEFVDFISNDSIKRYKETDKQYIPGPGKYIRQELYNDE
tara:strand:- start:362 stop:1084 length:723 start_codon:yes stop_codon:yes gene_type:complete